MLTKVKFENQLADLHLDDATRHRGDAVSSRPLERRLHAADDRRLARPVAGLRAARVPGAIDVEHERGTCGSGTSRRRRRSTTRAARTSPDRRSRRRACRRRRRACSPTRAATSNAPHWPLRRIERMRRRHALVARLVAGDHPLAEHLPRLELAISCRVAEHDVLLRPHVLARARRTGRRTVALPGRAPVQAVGEHGIEHRRAGLELEERRLARRLERADVGRREVAVLVAVGRGAAEPEVLQHVGRRSRTASRTRAPRPPCRRRRRRRRCCRRRRR